MPTPTDDPGASDPGSSILFLGLLGLAGLVGYVVVGRRRETADPSMPPLPPLQPSPVLQVQNPQFPTLPGSGDAGTAQPIPVAPGAADAPTSVGLPMPTPALDFGGAIERLSQGGSGLQEMRTLEPVLRAGIRDGGRPAIMRLLSLLATGDTALMAVIAGVLAERPTESRELLTAGLARDAPAELRPYYAHLLGLQRDREAASALVEATGDPDETVAYWARWALEQMDEE